MTRILQLLILISLFSAALCPGGAAQSVAAYLIADDQTGKILESKDPDRKVQVASLTKIATAMVVIDWAEQERQDLSQLAVVPPEALAAGGVNPVGLQPGDRLSLRDLLYASLLQSDNIAAHTLAAHVGRDLARLSPPRVRDLGPAGVFVAQMNALANTLGMTRTLFLNPHGLDSDERRPPFSTAADMARLTRYAMGKGGFRFYASQSQREIRVLRGDGSFGYVCRNTNQLLGANGVDGVKTGRTRLAGDCLIVSSTRQPETRKEGETIIVTPRRITVVVLGAADRVPVTQGLLNRGWGLYDAWAAQGRPVTTKDTL